MALKTRKIRVVGYPVLDDPSRIGEIEYVAVDAKTGAYIENQIDVAIKVDDDTGEIVNAEVVIDCRDIVLFDENGIECTKEGR